MAKKKHTKVQRQRRPRSVSASTAQPLNLDNEDHRNRATFSLGSKEPLPRVNEETLHKYHRHLAEHLTFPFEASYVRERGFLERKGYAITVLGLKGTEWMDDMYGLFGEARHQRRRIDVPLAEIEVKEDTPNRQLIEDYSSWFVNHR